VCVEPPEVRPRTVPAARVDRQRGGKAPGMFLEELDSEEFSRVEGRRMDGELLRWRGIRRAI
jgi:hypothetical protein